MSNDRISDALTRIRNGLQAKHESVKIPHSKLTERVVNLIKDEGYIDYVEVNADPKTPAKKTLNVGLKYKKDGAPKISFIQRVSTPGLRVYRKSPEKLTVRSGLGIQVLSTSKGILSDRQAIDQKVGGEVLAEIW